MRGRFVLMDTLARHAERVESLLEVLGSGAWVADLLTDVLTHSEIYGTHRSDAEWLKERITGAYLFPRGGARPGENGPARRPEARPVDRQWVHSLLRTLESNTWVAGFTADVLDRCAADGVGACTPEWIQMRLAQATDFAAQAGTFSQTAATRGTTVLNIHQFAEPDNQAAYAFREMPSVIAVANLKGGCGKSTIAVNLACELASKGNAVVLVDTDSQGTASCWIASGQLPIQGESMPLETAEDAELLTNKILASNAQYVVVDAPAHVVAATRAAGGLADLVLVPVTASGVDLQATAAAMDLIHKARASRGNRGPKCLIVPSKVDRRTGAGREIETALQRFGEAIGPAVHQRAAFADAFSAGKWVGQYAPDSPAHYDIASLTVAVKRTLRT